jgi:hypothetical protein
MKHLLYSILLLTLTTGCHKKTTSIITIQLQNVNNQTDGSHYANIRYNIVKTRPGYGIGKKAELIVAEDLNQNGYASFELEMNSKYNYSLAFARPDNICYTEVPPEYYMDINETNNITFNYAPCGYINLPRININCEGLNDKFRYKYFYSQDKDIYIYTGYIDADYNWKSDKFLSGCIDYSNAESYNSRPSGDYTIEWQVERPSGITTGIDYFTITESDTLTYELEY